MGKPRKSDTIASALLSRIVRGEHLVGSILPNETELSEEFAANRSAVREAVKRLEVHGLLRPIRKKGTVVCDPFRSLSAEVLRAMVCPRPGGLDAPMLRNLLEIRALIDVAMCGFAAERRSDAQLAKLQSLLAEVEAAGYSPRAFSDTIAAMGQVIARASQNRIFEMLLHWQDYICRDFEDVLMLSRVPTPARRIGLRRLVLAIEARDAETARALMSEHHRLASAAILQAVRSMSEGGS